MELAPGLYVTAWLEPGTAYVMDESFVGGSGIGGTGRSIALAQRDWERIAPAERERLLDLYVKRSADWGVDELQRWLNSEVSHG